MFDNFGPFSAFQFGEWNGPGFFPEYVNLIPGQPASTPKLIFNSVADFSNPTVLSDPENRKSVSYSLNLCSKPKQDFKIYAEVFEDNLGNPTVVSIDPTLPGLTSWSAINREVLNQMSTINSDPVYWQSFNNRENYPNFSFDNSVSTQLDGKRPSKYIFSVKRERSILCLNKIAKRCLIVKDGVDQNGPIWQQNTGGTMRVFGNFAKHEVLIVTPFNIGAAN